MTLEELLADIHACEEDLLSFERKYGIRSETLYAAYQNGEEPEDTAWMLDFGEWASVYRTYLVRQAEYRNEIQRRQRRVPGLTAGPYADYWNQFIGAFADDEWERPAQGTLEQREAWYRIDR